MRYFFQLTTRAWWVREGAAAASIGVRVDTIIDVNCKWWFSITEEMEHECGKICLWLLIGVQFVVSDYFQTF